jgi:GNAT superfamily N-acetyltransferase
MAHETEGLQLSEETVRKGVLKVFQDPSVGEYLIAEHTLPSLLTVPAGCLLLQKEWSDWRNGVVEWMHSVYVVRDERRKGFFTWMHKVACARARTRGSLGLRLYVDKNNSSAQRIYERLGLTNNHYELFEELF